MLSSPLRQNSHVPQKKFDCTATRAPISHSVTSGPSSITRPASSPPVIRGSSGLPIWQRNYYEHIVRDEADLGHIREYIESNPAKWEVDQLHPDNPSKW